MSASPNRVVAVLSGAAHLAVGGLGFAVTGGLGPFEAPGRLLAGLLELNPAQNIVHLLVAAALLVAGLVGTRAARAANTAVGTLYLVLGLAGLFVVGTPANVLALNGVANVLHFAFASLLLAVGLGADRPQRA